MAAPLDTFITIHYFSEFLQHRSLYTHRGHVTTLQAENTHLLCKGKKYHCMADLLLVLFGFSYFADTESETYLLVWLYPNKPNRRSAVKWYFPYEVSECSLLQVDAFSVISGSRDKFVVVMNFVDKVFGAFNAVKVKKVSRIRFDV